ncbi:MULTISPECIES: bifunctional proline dehydrogenase/L-glutamate gamma-semialdehyde dehydrogenase PutA [unclassified Saccharibacter]|uniref:bifunctional proline dehydrogenase/L-glutamate gamma-semialdehyde dehydrogenase PutA n=1 Tax=unclassified Saccharibacter TaxID=2648722 RepID=UPI001326BA5B|nr:MULTISPECIES: bifunctional proline dehydrogenase/L-glutamate gamma-semialdehyde dehydrogenase PutA [unclassified Saccharibacter]MXV36731.1 bifunctional proline dehydrogenase/L-glutamate gamma-semialdehyde dehydrogenase PutA [Saccharibacter sp. EH611]MXV58223.1 bifunctional proline dehydrogenase/L-glutamate gamma-semialdehyde dehydrogenase PutA [Saccharibacter sp. EH70]MXV65679.1 bifunctional proline dehydrogenase/L-glutamate gamma-semialdehyde dehydrogenase PutA [Saccharibacter sp. EH60]
MAYFSEHFELVPQRSTLRQAITHKTRCLEEECVTALLPDAELNEKEEAIASSVSLELAHALRENRRPGLVESLVQEFSLASDEGVALMSMAEALLRTPDKATRDALISDQISVGDWLSHAGRGQGVVINAASWGLALTGKIIAPDHRMGVVQSMMKRHGEPVVRQAMQVAMQMMGGQFVLGETIEKALKGARTREAEGFTYSYDMLGEAALDKPDCEAYQAAYHHALEEIGRGATGEGMHERPGLSIKLSALHPRYYRSQYKRVMTELLPTVKQLAVRAKHYNIGLNIDAEESERLELSLDILEALCRDPDLANWDGIGLVVQAYSRRAPAVLDYVIDLARETNHRIMVRLVKGAYWDSELKKAQIDGVSDFTLFTRKSHTDVSYIACARKLMNATDAVFPQFATHNARTVASIYAMQGDDFFPGQYEFQCLHGMGEGLYEEVVGPHKLNRPCRIYAPVGTYDTLLAYLVRRLLENGANSSFINLLGDSSVELEKLVEDPVAITRTFSPVGVGHSEIAQPKDMFGEERRNSTGMDFSDENVLTSFRESLLKLPEQIYAEAMIPGRKPQSEIQPVFNPANRQDQVGTVQNATISDVPHAVENAEAAFPTWAAKTPEERASILERASDLLEQKDIAFLGMAVREAGKSYPNAVAELREAVDFLRYYAAQIRREFDNETHRPLGPVVCISPWNFPLAIFLGQISAALAAGNTVLAKPAEETPLIAMMAVEAMHEAGVPKDVLQYLPGEGDVGAALVADERVAGVMFTGSTAVAQAIARQLAGRLGRNGQPVPLVAETGGLNAMIVDSSALPEQVVTDIVTSAFDSAGQRCSALRLLCVQEEAADRVISLLKGAMAELRVGAPARLETDVGPVISEQAKSGIEAHVEALREKHFPVYEAPMTDEAQQGSFVAPTLVEVHTVEDLGQEVFGPVLHVLRYPRRGLDGLIDEINESGYGLTFGVHSRVASTINQLVERVEVGNVYVNRNIVGAIVGVQPFGGRGLSGTGPKAGGPLAVRRQLAEAPMTPLAIPGAELPDIALSWLMWLGVEDHALTEAIIPWMEHGLLDRVLELPSPVGESNVYSLKPRGRVLALADTEAGLKRIISYAVSCNNDVAFLSTPEVMKSLDTMSDVLREHITPVRHKGDIAGCSVIVAETDSPVLWDIVRDLLANPKQPIPTVYLADEETLRPEFLLEEQVISTNTAAVGGNAQLLSLS